MFSIMLISLKKNPLKLNKLIICNTTNTTFTWLILCFITFARVISNLCDMHTYVCVSGVKNVRFSKHLACFVFLLPLFWDLPFCLITEGLCDSTLSYFEISASVPTASKASKSNKRLGYTLEEIYNMSDLWILLSASLNQNAF